MKRRHTRNGAVVGVARGGAGRGRTGGRAGERAAPDRANAEAGRVFTAELDADAAAALDADAAPGADVVAGLDHLWSPAEFEALERVLRRPE